MTTVADAIRSKTGGAEPLSFPTGFVTAVEGITTGGDSGLLDSLSKREYGFEATNPVNITADMMTEYVCIPGALFQGAYIGKDGVDLSGLPDNFIALNMGNMFEGCSQRYKESLEGEWKLGGDINLGRLGSNTGLTAFKKSKLKKLPKGMTTSAQRFNECSFHEDLVLDSSSGTDIGGLSGVFKMNLIDDTKSSLTITITEEIVSIGKASGYPPLGGTGDYPLKLVMKSSTPTVLYRASSLSNLESITVPKGSLEAYQSATNWAEYADIMVEADT